MSQDGSPLEPFVDAPGTPAHGARRCQRVKRDGQQCGHPARRGWSVCTHHGAGSRKRELSGERKPAGNGLIPKDRRDFEQYERADPEFAARRAQYLENREQLFNLETHMADLRALADVLSARVAAVRARGGGEVPPALLQALKAITDGLEACSRIAARQRAHEGVPVEQVRAAWKKVVDVLIRYVAPERFDAAILEFRHIERPRAPIEEEAS